MEPIYQMSEGAIQPADAKMIVLSPEYAHHDAIETAIHGVPALKLTSAIKQTDERQHGMYKYVCGFHEGWLNERFDNLTRLVLSAQQQERVFSLWVAHKAVIDLALHDNALLFDVSQCSLGALSNPSTFSSHIDWNEADYHIRATFDFDEDKLKVNIEKWKMEIAFSELKRAFLVQPKMKDGVISYSLYMYLSSVPSFWNVVLKERIIQIPGVEVADIGRCSFLKLDLINTKEDELATLLDKLDACEFDVWWTSLINVLPGQQFLDDVHAPWPIQWLLSEGYRISDQLSSDDMQLLYKHKEVLYAALKPVIAREIVVDVMKELKAFLQDPGRNNVKSLTPKLPNNYKLVRKLMVTPMRVIFMSPEPVPMNRVIRKYNPENFMMVLFRDENLQPMSLQPPSAFSELVKRIKMFLSNGVKVEGRTYRFVGCSNSQLRNHSCWLYANDPENEATVEEIRHWIGDLADSGSVAMYVSRIGQLFTSSVKTIDLSGQNYRIVEIPDVERNGYCFTDGFGKISKSLSKAIAKECGLCREYSAYQIQFGGCKGILTTDPQTPEGEVLIRPSMKRFDSSDQILEVVDHSHPQRAYLDRHVITLLSQRGIADNVFFRLQDEYLHSLLELFTSKERTFQELDDVQSIFDIKELHDRGMSVPSDPFFRSLLLVRYRERLNDLLETTKIPLPLDKGRVLMGVVDETGQLKPGQVFIQYSNDINHPHAQTTVVTDRVMVTQTPCLHPGDLRVFQAVDCPELVHLVDCLVFPSQGDRPHSSEISRPDPDNNLYWTTWHPKLIIHENDEPKEMSRDNREELQRTPTEEDVVEYIADFMYTDLRDIVETHLAHADRENEGIYSNECLELTQLYKAAANFSKPAQIPPELKPRKYPDFMMKENKPRHNSDRILGKLYRDASHLVLATNLQLDAIEELWKTDKRYIYRSRPEIGNVDIPDCYLQIAETYYEDYAARLQNLLDKYRVKDESHLFGGFVYNTMRKEEEERDLLMQAEINQLKMDFTEIFESQDIYVGVPTKALTWLNIAYNRGRLRSFAWIGSSVLASVVQSPGMKLLCGITDEEYLKLENTFNALDPDDEIKQFLEIQAHAAETFLQQVASALPSLQCSLIPIDLAKWHLPSRDIFLRIEHRDRNLMEKEFGQICSVLRNLSLTQGNTTFNGEHCYITKERIAIPFTSKGHEFLGHVYIKKEYTEVLSDIASHIGDGWLGRCLQILSQYWILHCRQSLRKHISVIDICNLLLHCMKKDVDARLCDVLQRIFRIFTDSDTLKNKDLLNLPSKYFRQLQMNLFEGMQTLVISGMCFLLNHTLNRFQHRIIRKMITLSTTTSEILLGQNVRGTVMICGGRVQVRRILDEACGVCVAELFGTKEEMIKLTDETEQLENACEVELSCLPLWKEKRETIFEHSKTGKDKLVFIPYNKCSYLPNYYKKITPIVQPVSNYVGKKRNFKKVINRYTTIIDRTRVRYDEQNHGQLRLVCRFTNFHFYSRCFIEDRTVGGFRKLRESGELSNSHYPANVNSEALESLLQSKRFVKDEMAAYKTVVTFRKISTESKREKFEIVFGKDLEVIELSREKRYFGIIEFLRGLKKAPHSRNSRKMADLYFRLEAIRNMPDWNLEPYSVLTKCEEPIFDVVRSRSEDEMPFLHIRPQFAKDVEFMVQKKVTTYRYPASEVAHRPDHFTAHVEVQVSKVREYDFRKGEFNDLEKVVIFLPTLPPLCHRDVHCDLMRKMLDLAWDIGNSLP